MIEQVLKQYGLHETHAVPFGTGLINRTWKVASAEGEFILQRIEDKIFKQPRDIASNIRAVADYLKQHAPGYLFVTPVSALNSDDLVVTNDGYYRLFPFIKNSHAIDVVQTPEQAYEAARQFGRFTRLLSGLDVTKLKATIPFFHDLLLRYQQFLQALENGKKERIHASRHLIETACSYADIVEQYQSIQSNPAFKLRVTHHDTKISNVLFNAEDEGICVIDLDTVMPGYFISDVGDMMRTYLSQVSEEEADVSKIEVREAFYKAVVEGYHSEMKDELSAVEKQSFFFAGKFMIYMQALRFLSDYLSGDVYYGARYEEHNLVRATNQLTLLQQLVKKQDVLEKCIEL